MASTKDTTASEFRLTVLTFPTKETWILCLARSGLYVYTHWSRCGRAWANLSLMPRPILNTLCLSERILDVILVCTHAVWVGTHILVWVSTHIWFGAGSIKSGVFTTVTVWPRRLSKGKYYSISLMASAKNTPANEFCLTVLTFSAKEKWILCLALSGLYVYVHWSCYETHMGQFIADAQAHSCTMPFWANTGRHLVLHACSLGRYTNLVRRYIHGSGPYTQNSSSVMDWSVWYVFVYTTGLIESGVFTIVPIWPRRHSMRQNVI